eukprot:5850391-Pyramimonas_sp.AAC.1
MSAKPDATLDYFCLSSGLALKARGVQVLEDASTYPHLPVQLTMEVAENHMWARFQWNQCRSIRFLCQGARASR